MDYASLHQHLIARGVFRIKPGLDRVCTVLEKLLNPQDRVPSIHIAGTNGKGSVASSLESVFRQSGYRTGLYTSPHLSDVRERIQIQGAPLTADSFQKTAERIFEVERQTQLTLTYFEFLTVMAFLAFSEASLDIMVIEVGMGGRWDATNILRHPVLTLITSIGLDHTQWLGRTETAIAREKAGIIKPQVPLIIGAQGKAAQIITQTANDRHAPHWQIGVDFHAESESVQWDQGFQRISYTGIHGFTRSIALNLLGRYQIQNAAMLLAGLDVLQRRGWKQLSPRSIENGLAHVNWRGRFQHMTDAHGIDLLFDGAHNPAAMKQFFDSLKHSPWQRRPKTFVFSAYQDKDYRQMLRLITPHAKEIILCTLSGPRALRPQALTSLCKKSKTKIRHISHPRQALQTALRDADPDRVIIVTGSLALVGHLLAEQKTIAASPIEKIHWKSALSGALLKGMAHV